MNKAEPTQPTAEPEDREKIESMMRDIRLLQEKTRKYKTRATDAERQVQSLNMKVGDQQTKSEKMLALLKEYKKNGSDPADQKRLEERLQVSTPSSGSSGCLEGCGW